MWRAFSEQYLDDGSTSLVDIYSERNVSAIELAVAEALRRFDALFSAFRHAHMSLVHRMLGADSVSLKGLPVQHLKDTVDTLFFPDLWRAKSGADSGPATDNNELTTGTDGVHAMT